MNRAKLGDRVLVHYTSRLKDGSVIHSSHGSAPLAFTLGEGSVLPHFDRAVVGMEAGESRSICVPAEDAYGVRCADGVWNVACDCFPVLHGPTLGNILQERPENGRSMAAHITDISATRATLDTNHPLAGFDIFFELELVSIL